MNVTTFFRGAAWASWALVPLVAACGEVEEAPRVGLPVVVDGSGAQSVVTSLGYQVELSSVRLAVRSIVFIQPGAEATAASWLRPLHDALAPRAYAHPGHFEGGEITGELQGRFVVDWRAGHGATLGEAVLLTGAYAGSGFTFDQADASQVASDDPLLSHSAFLTGTASTKGSTITFELVVDFPEGRRLDGMPFEAEIVEGSSAPIRFGLVLEDPFLGSTLFDGIDFSTLQDLPRVSGPALDRFRRALGSHDYYLAHTGEDR